jgi:D-aminopeptidase
MKFLKSIWLLLLITSSLVAQKPRARDIGIPFNGTPGKFNAITDVKGVEVGYSTIISGQGENIRGKGPVRTGVTAILPRGRNNNPVFANWYSLNGNGEMTGTTWITESGFLETPIMITNTNSVGVVRDAVLKWFVKTGWYKEDFWYTYPVVAETYDGFLNDIYGFHVTESNAYEALDNAKTGPLQEGNIGGGTGMMCLGFKGGTGTASRVVNIADSTYTVGVLVQSNFGGKNNFTIAGVPIGKELKDTLNYEFKAPPSYKPGDGSIIVVVATDAPLLPHQLKRIAARVPIGVGIVGGRGENGSGDIFIAFSTANPSAFQRTAFTKVDELPNDLIDPLFDATVEAVEEAIINAMVAAETMEGINGNKAYALPHDAVGRILKKYNVKPPVPVKVKTEIKVDEKILRKYVGTYELNPQVKIEITMENGVLFAQATGQPRFRLFAQQENLFFIKAFEAEVEFVRSAKGVVENLILHQGEKQRTAKKTK